MNGASLKLLVSASACFALLGSFPSACLRFLLFIVALCSLLLTHLTITFLATSSEPLACTEREIVILGMGRLEVFRTVSATQGLAQKRQDTVTLGWCITWEDSPGVFLSIFKLHQSGCNVCSNYTRKNTDGRRCPVTYISSRSEPEHLPSWCSWSVHNVINDRIKLCDIAYLHHGHTLGHASSLNSGNRQLENHAAYCITISLS